MNEGLVSWLYMGFHEYASMIGMWWDAGLDIVL